MCLVPRHKLCIPNGDNIEEIDNVGFNDRLRCIMELSLNATVSFIRLHYDTRRKAQVNVCARVSALATRTRVCVCTRAQVD